VQGHLHHWSSPTSGKLTPQQNQVDNQLSALAIRNQFSNLDFSKQHVMHDALIFFFYSSNASLRFLFFDFLTAWQINSSAKSVLSASAT